MKATNTNSRVFTPVDYRQFRQFIATITTKKIKGKGYETVIYDLSGNIQAIVHAASIDNEGNCHPAEYYVRTTSLTLELPQAA